MNFTHLKTLVFNHIHTLLFLIGLVIVLSAITLLTSMEWGLLALGITLIGVALTLNNY